MSDAASLAGLSDTLFTLTILVYSVATLAFAAELAFSHRASAKALVAPDGSVVSDQGAPSSSRIGQVAIAVALLGTALLGAVLLLRGLAAERIPLGNMFELATAVAFVGVVGFLFLALRTPRLRTVGLFVMLPVTLGLVLVGLFLYTESGPLVAALRSRWLVVHVTTVSIGFGAFLTSGIISVLFLVRSRFEEAGSAVRGMTSRIGQWLPNSETLDRAAHRMVVFGFPIFTFAVIAGAVWAESAWGRFWGWDPKETWAFIAWIVYAAYLHARATAGWRGGAAAWINVAGLVVMFFNLLYVNLVTSGLHSYAGIS